MLGKQIEKNGLEPEQLTITDEAMHQIISGYTREAGVRNLERKIGEICRKAAREIYEGTCESVFVDENSWNSISAKNGFMWTGSMNRTRSVSCVAWHGPA